jgi:hypothetical protein
MVNMGISKIECPYFKLFIQNNPAAVNVFDEEAVPLTFKKQVVSWSIDKVVIKHAIKGGKNVAGATLTNGNRLVIK